MGAKLSVEFFFSLLFAELFWHCGRHLQRWAGDFGSRFRFLVKSNSTSAAPTSLRHNDDVRRQSAIYFNGAFALQSTLYFAYLSLCDGRWLG